MPTLTDTPNGVGAKDLGWGLWGAATSKVDAVQTNDGDTSVVFASSGGALREQTFTFPSLLGVTDPVTAASLTAVTREYLKGGGGRSYYLQWNSTQVGSNQEATVHAASPNYVSISYAASGATLALAVVNGEHGLQFSAAGGPSNKAEFWVTHLYRTIDFAYGVGGAGQFSYLIGSLVGALIGANLLLRDMPRLSRALGRFRLRPDEYEPAWRDWRERKRMVMA
jgi:hypothetical protein